jgi:hypothetical protein
MIPDNIQNILEDHRNWRRSNGIHFFLTRREAEDW